jgi:predicted O-methyltransferase YrrM
MPNSVETLEDQYYRECLSLGRPYFGSIMAARQGNPVRHSVMRALVGAECEGKGDSHFRILEIGSWAGGSAITWADALKRHHGGKGCVVCVDAWSPYFRASGYSDLSDDDAEAYREMHYALAAGRIFDLFRHNIRASRHDDLIVPVKGFSELVLPFLRDQAFNLVFVDGDHTLPHVLQDIRCAQRLVAEGGILCGDDLEAQIGEVDAAHARANGHRDYIRDLRTGTWYHPGLTLAVAEVFGEVSVSEGVWGVRRTAGGWEPAVLPPPCAENHALPEHLRDDANPTLLAQGYRGYNIVRYRIRCYALAQSIGPVDLPRLPSKVLAGFRERGLCLVGDSITEVKTACEEHPRDVELLQVGYRSYNLVRLGKTIYGLAQSLGAVDLPSVSQAILQDWIAQGVCVVGTAAQQVRDRLDAVARRTGEMN